MVGRGLTGRRRRGRAGAQPRGDIGLGLGLDATQIDGLIAEERVRWKQAVEA
jgi:hypothetical protein